MDPSARDDGLAEWYDELLADLTPAAADVLERLLGRGPGHCLALGRGTGLRLQTYPPRLFLRARR